MEFFQTLVIGFFPILIILALAGFASMFSERCGIVNIGINGVMIIGAVFFSIFANAFSKAISPNEMLSPWLNLIIIPLAAFVGMCFNLLHGVAVIKLRANHVISGVAINALALGISLILLRILGNGNKINYQIHELAISASDQNFGNIFSYKLFIIIIAFIVILVGLNKTKWGLRFKAVGENPQSAATAGISVNAIKWQGILISGLLAGLSGAIYSQFRGSNSFNGSVDGLGFLALAIMIMGQWRPSFIFLSTIGFSIIYMFAIGILSTNQANLIKVKDNFGSLFSAIPYVVTLIVLAIFSRNSRAPKASGETYDQAKR